MATLAGHGLRGAYDPEHRNLVHLHPARALGVRAMQAASRGRLGSHRFRCGSCCTGPAAAAGNGSSTRNPRVSGDGVLLAGAGGAGKSGTTLAGILHGLSSVGDDYVAVRANGGRVEAGR